MQKNIEIRDRFLTQVGYLFIYFCFSKFHALDTKRALGGYESKFAF